MASYNECSRRHGFLGANSSISAILLTVSLLLLAIVQPSAEQVSYTRMRKLMETSYDRRRPPSITGDKPLAIGLGAHIREITLDELRRAMTVHVEVTQNWTDDRLRPVTQDTADLILSNDDVTALVWTPALLLTEVSCSNFTGHLRPLVCSLYLQIEGNADSDVTLKWDSVTVEPRLSVPGFTLVGLDTLDCTESTSVGSFACRQLSFAFREDVDFFATELYGASFLLVLLSWVGFWVDGGRTDVRLGLGLGVLLPLVVYSVGFRMVHVKVGVPGSVEVWVAFCVAFVLASLVEFAFVHALMRFASARVLSLSRTGSTRQQGSPDQQGCQSAETNNLVKAARFIDVASGIAFPLLFVIYNFVYWSMY